MENNTNTINATQTSFKILELVRTEEAVTTTEISDELGLAKSAVHKHLQTFVELNLRCLAGLEILTSGALEFDSVDVTEVPAHHRGLAMIHEVRLDLAAE